MFRFTLNALNRTANEKKKTNPAFHRKTAKEKRRRRRDEFVFCLFGFRIDFAISLSARSWSVYLAAINTLSSLVNYHQHAQGTRHTNRNLWTRMFSITSHRIASFVCFFPVHSAVRGVVRSANHEQTQAKWVLSSTWFIVSSFAYKNPGFRCV